MRLENGAFSSNRAFCSEFRVYAAKGGEYPSRLKSLCEKQNSGNFENEKLVQISLRENQNVPYHKCGRRIFEPRTLQEFFTQALNAELQTKHPLASGTVRGCVQRG